MTRQIFVNLPVADVARSMAFYAAVGAVNNPGFTGDGAACMVWSDTINVMVMTHDKWRQFVSRPIVDAHGAAQVILCLMVDSRDEVVAMVDKAAAAGGVADPSPPDDYDFMYGRSFEDPDGHLWAVNWMNPDAPPPHG